MFGVVTPNIIFAQNNRISIQTGLFHSFFDKSPILNVYYTNKVFKPFRGLLYNSVGIQYQRNINAKSVISIEYSRYRETYLNVSSNVSAKNVIWQRMYNTFNTTYSRNIELTSKFVFTYGIGLNFRYGEEIFCVQRYDFESAFIRRYLKDLGINIRSGLEYSPLKWLTLYSKFDLLTFVYVNQPANIKNFKKNNEVGNYPSYFDLSWQFGIGFNFGK